MDRGNVAADVQVIMAAFTESSRELITSVGLMPLRELLESLYNYRPRWGRGRTPTSTSTMTALTCCVTW